MKIVFNEWMKEKKAFLLIIIAVAMNCAFSILDSALVIKIRNVLDNISDSTLILPVIIISITCIILVCLREIVTTYAISRNMSRMTIRWHRKLAELDFRLFTKYSSSEIYTISEFPSSCSKVMRQFIRLIECGVSIIATLAGIYILGGKLIIPVIILYVCSSILFKYLFKIYGKVDLENHEYNKLKNQEIENTINGFSDMRAFGNQNYHVENMKSIVDKVFTLSMKRCKLTATINTSFGLVDYIGMILVLFYCINQVQLGSMTSATAMSLVMYAFRIINPLADILNLMDTFSQSVATAKDYNEIMNYVNNIHCGDIKMTDFNSSIEIKNLSFKYNESSSVLNNINMRINKRQKIGIVGASGNGKSTLVKLMLHFYEPTDGSVCIDGIDIREITDESFRKIIGTVQQENTIYPGSIMDNITYGTEHVLEYEIIEACKRASIYDFIMSLPEKFDSEVGPRGLKLSGGQKQRIALARLFLKNPEIIILDEATSALDNETETIIQDAIDGLKDKTIITIAHRLSTVKNCDVIYVLNNNTIEEFGSHEQLVEKRGLYYNMLK